VATYEIRYERKPGEKKSPERRSFITIFAESDTEAQRILWNAKRTSAFLRGRATWVVKIPYEEKVA
jgi:hypothetical protein